MPAFKSLFTFNRSPHVIELFVIDKAFNLVSFREAIKQSFAVLENASREVVCNADIKRSIFLVCEDVNVSSFHDLNSTRLFVYAHGFRTTNFPDRIKNSVTSCFRNDAEGEHLPLLTRKGRG